jgi:hypothetical protein
MDEGVTNGDIEEVIVLVKIVVNDWILEKLVVIVGVICDVNELKLVLLIE